MNSSDSTKDTSKSLDELIEKLGDLCHVQYLGCEQVDGQQYYAYRNEVINMLDTPEAKQAIQSIVDKAVLEALEKHHPAILTSGKKVGLYKILDRVNEKKAGHTKKLRVKCVKCGEIMFRTNNRLQTEHRFCPKREALNS